RRLEPRAFTPAGDGVAATELLRLPRPHRLERVDCRDVRDAVEQLREVAAEVRVPGVRVDEVGALDGCAHLQVDRDRLQRGGPTGAGGKAPRGRVGDGRGPVARGPVGAPDVHRHVDKPLQLRGQILDVASGTAVDVGRILACEDGDLHART